MSKLRESAKGQDCTIRLIGVCNHNPETTVLCHANGSAAGKGIGMKSPDILGAFGCSACHAVLDRMAPRPKGMSLEEVQLAFHQGHQRTMRYWLEMGLVKV